jgi:hypothetical protein
MPLGLQAGAKISARGDDCSASLQVAASAVSVHTN